MFKNEKGITLVALIITVIVLLILAGISLAMVVGDNGIITRSKRAKYETMTAEAEEKLKLAVAAAQMEIEEKQINDGSYVMTAANFASVLSEDGITSGSNGWTVSPNTGTTAFTTVTVTFSSEEYQKAGQSGHASTSWVVTNTNGNLTIGDATKTDSWN